MKRQTAARTRVRLEFTAIQKGAGLGFVLDKRFTALRVLMRERFGALGEHAVDDWLATVAKNAREKRTIWYEPGGAHAAGK